jgi:uncharacterized membrane protein YkoI
MKVRRTALVMLWLCGLGAVSLVSAAPPAAAHGAISIDQAVKMAEQRYSARVVKAETQKDGARTVYVLKLYNKSAGKVWSVRVDAASGAVL